MKYLKSTSEDLKLLFDQQITVKHIAESLRSFDDNAGADQVKDFMEEMEFDVIGVRQRGKISGFALQKDLNRGQLKDYLRKFEDSEIISNTTSLITVFNSLKERERLYIESFNEVSAIVTKGDLQKHPVRMWLFGIISLVEMQMLRIIRKFCPGDLWMPYIKKDGRMRKARNTFNNRVQNNQQIDLVDCLQLCDKREIFINDQNIMNSNADFNRNKIEILLVKTEEIRNRIAHSQDFLIGYWPEITIVVEELIRFLEKCESIQN